MGGALEARGIDASDGNLVSDTVGEVEVDGKVLVIKRITTTYTLKGVADEDREKVERVLGFHADYCPVARSIGGCIDIETAVVYA